MKKLLVLLLCMLLLTPAALAEVMDFGDFNMDLPTDMPGAMYEKANGQMFLYLCPFYNDDDVFQPSISVVWIEAVEDLTADDPVAFAELLMGGYQRSLEAAGAVVNDAVLHHAVLDEQDGVPSIVATYSFDADFSALGGDKHYKLYYAECVVSVEGIGSYTFTIATPHLEQMEPMMEILNTVTWNF